MTPLAEIFVDTGPSDDSVPDGTYAWTNVDLASIRSCGIHSRLICPWILKISIPNCVWNLHIPRSHYVHQFFFTKDQRCLCGIHLRAIPLEMLMKFRNLCSDITLLKLLPHLPRDNELIAGGGGVITRKRNKLLQCMSDWLMYEHQPSILWASHINLHIAWSMIIYNPDQLNRKFRPVKMGFCCDRSPPVHMRVPVLMACHHWSPVQHPDFTKTGAALLSNWPQSGNFSDIRHGVTMLQLPYFY